MYIEPSLQSTIESHVKIALATFAPNRDEQILRNTALATFAGLGLARANVQDGGEVTWVKTDRLKELEKSPTAPVALSTFAAPVAEGFGEPKMTGSLKLIIEDFIATEREQDPETGCNVDGLLLGLAGQGQAYLVPINTDGWTWRAAPALIDRYKMGKQSIRRFGGRKPKIRMDEILTSIREMMMELAGLRFGTKLGRDAIRAGTIALLLSQEMDGEAVAYKDEKGRLAWKASEKLQRSRNEP